MTNRTIAEVLDLAADIVDFEGWTQGAIRVRGKVCLVGAVQEASWRSKVCGLDWEICRVVADQLGHASARFPHAHLVAFNDASGRKREEVSELLRRTAKGLRETT